MTSKIQTGKHQDTDFSEAYNKDKRYATYIANLTSVKEPSLLEYQGYCRDKLTNEPPGKYSNLLHFACSRGYLFFPFLKDLEVEVVVDVPKKGRKEKPFGNPGSYPHWVVGGKQCRQYSGMLESIAVGTTCHRPDCRKVV